VLKSNEAESDIELKSTGMGMLAGSKGGHSMKDRPKYFLAEDKIDHNGEIFDYIRELHDYLWHFVHRANPSASGNLRDFVDAALKQSELEQGVECYVQCSRCGAKVSNTVKSSIPEGLVVRAFIECANCVKKQPDLTEPKVLESLRFLVDKYWKNQTDDYSEGFITCITPGGIPEYWKDARRAISQATVDKALVKETL